MNHTEHVLKIVEQIPENFIYILLKLMPCTSDSCSDVRQGMWCKGHGAKCIRKNHNLLFASVVLEKSFHRSNRKFLQQALLKSWIVWVGYIFRADELKKEVRWGWTSRESDTFNIPVDGHWGVVWSLYYWFWRHYRNIHTGSPWELLHDDNLVILAKSKHELILKLD